MNINSINFAVSKTQIAMAGQKEYATAVRKIDDEQEKEIKKYNAVIQKANKAISQASANINIALLNAKTKKNDLRESEEYTKEIQENFKDIDTFDDIPLQDFNYRGETGLLKFLEEVDGEHPTQKKTTAEDIDKLVPFAIKRCSKDRLTGLDGIYSNSERNCASDFARRKFGDYLSYNVLYKNDNSAVPQAIYLKNEQTRISRDERTKYDKTKMSDYPEDGWYEKHTDITMDKDGRDWKEATVEVMKKWEFCKPQTIEKYTISNPHYNED